MKLLKSTEEAKTGKTNKKKGVAGVPSFIYFYHRVEKGDRSSEVFLLRTDGLVRSRCSGKTRTVQSRCLLEEP